MQRSATSNLKLQTPSSEFLLLVGVKKNIFKHCYLNVLSLTIWIAAFVIEYLILETQKLLLLFNIHPSINPYMDGIFLLIKSKVAGA